jgi:glycosyltransferase involved in cell wall biosynthesis
MIPTMKVALVHHWLTGMRGGEKVLEAFCELFPQAVIFTLVCDPPSISDKIRRHRIVASFLQKLPGSPSRFRAYLPLFPMAAARLDLCGYDMVITSDASLIKAIRVPRGTPHVCYCHSPPRYLWDFYDLYRREEAGLLQRMAMPVISPLLRKADYRAAQSIDHFIANSAAVAERIRRHYQRDATVIYPPVDVDYFTASPRQPEDFYLFVGQLVAYKRADLAIAAFARLDRRLIIVGDGPQRHRLEASAPKNIRFIGWTTDEELRSYYARCRSLIFPNEEDFGIVPVEAQAAGAPVIAFAKGGALETVFDGQTGVHFSDPTPAGLQAAITRFESIAPTLSPTACLANSRRFSREIFTQRIREFLTTVVPARLTESLGCSMTA